MIIAGTFTPEVGYNEVYLAKKIAELGHEVRVITTILVSNRVKDVLKIKQYQSGWTEIDNYKIFRIPIWFTLGTIIIPKAGIKKNITEFKPDLVILPAIAKFFPIFGALYKKKIKYKLLSWYADLFLHRKSKVKTLLFKYVKRPWYRYVMNQSDMIVVATPETKELLFSLMRAQDKKKLEKKMVQLSLGFDEKIFFIDPKLGKENRRKYGIPDDCVVFISASKAEPRKKWEFFIEAIASLKMQGYSAKLILVGLSSNPYSEMIVEKIKEKGLENEIIALSFQNHTELNGLYNAADAGIWISPTIGILEGMGTGLPIGVPKKPSMIHLLYNQRAGWFLQENDLNDSFKKIYMDCSQKNDKCVSRQLLAEKNSQYFSYKSLVKQILF